jgi:hypothetical protein
LQNPSAAGVTTPAAEVVFREFDPPAEATLPSRLFDHPQPYTRLSFTANAIPMHEDIQTTHENHKASQANQPLSHESWMLTAES